MTGQSDLEVWGVGTTRTLRVHWMLHELGLPYSTHRIESRTGETTTDEYLKLNPKHKIPTLIHGNFAVSESFAIMRYLRRLSDVLPFDEYQQTAQGQAAYDEWASFLLMELDATSLYVVRRHGGLPQIYGEAPAAVSSSITYFEDMFEAAADRIPDAGFVWGSTFSEIDILLAIASQWGRMVKAEIPAVAERHRARMEARVAYQTAREHNFRDLQLATGTPS